MYLFQDAKVHRGSRSRGPSSCARTKTTSRMTAVDMGWLVLPSGRELMPSSLVSYLYSFLVARRSWPNVSTFLIRVLHHVCVGFFLLLLLLKFSPRHFLVHRNLLKQVTPILT